MQLFYHPDLDKSSKNVEFSKDESRHIVRVLRKNTGDELQVTNGRGQLFKVQISHPNPNRCKAEIKKITEEQLPEWKLHLAVAPTKMNDRYEWFLEKATEIGIDEITPVICEHSERKMVKLNRYERVLQSAMKQSLHYRLPQLNEIVSLKDFLKKEIPGQKFIAHCEDDKPRKSLKKEIKPGENVSILIGPEGDFSPEEIEIAIQNNWHPVSLGNTRLRTETAAIVASHTVVLMNE